MLKPLINRAIRKLLNRCKNNSRFVLYQVIKELKSIEAINSLNELKRVKFVGAVIFDKIKTEVEKINEKGANINLYQEAPAAFGMSQTIAEEMSKIKIEMEHLSSNLSELEAKYAAEDDQADILAENEPELQLFGSFGLTQEMPENFSSDDIELDQNVGKSSENADLSSEEIKISQLTSNLSNLNTSKSQNNLLVISSDTKSAVENKEAVQIQNALDSMRIDSTSESISGLKNSLVKNVSKIGSSRASISNLLPRENFENSTVELSEIGSRYSITIPNTLPNSLNNTQIKDYIPTYRSAPYAVLKSLYLNLEGLHRSLLPLWASKFTDTEFDKTKKFSGFNCLKSLTDKDLIILDEKKYYLTEKGRILCSKMNFTCDESVVINDDVVYMLIDARERNSRDFLYFQQKFPNQQTRQLEAGDFTWIKNEKMLNYIVERKESLDFLQSAADGRFKDQKSRLLNLKNFNVFYIIENKISSKSCNRSIAAMKMSDVIVIETKGLEQTVIFLTRLNNFITELYADSLPEEPMGFGSFVENATKRREKPQDEIFYDTLTRIKGVTPSKAEEIMSKYQRLSYFVEKCISDKSGVIKELASIKTGTKSLGKALSARIVQMITE